jgi:hypothetical protein
VGSLFVYTHEEHPGEHYPHLTSIEQKVRHAKALRDVLGVKRPILFASLGGFCHLAYGSMPNMSWIFTNPCVPAYKSDYLRSIAVMSLSTTALAQARMNGLQ